MVDPYASGFARGSVGEICGYRDAGFPGIAGLRYYDPGGSDSVWNGFHGRFSGLLADPGGGVVA